MKMRRKAAGLLLALLAAIAAGAQASDFNETTRLAGLAKVWGFLKYYHPEVAKGEINWDQALIDVYEKAKTAGTREAFNQVLSDLFFAAGNVDFLNYPNPVPGEPNDDPLFAWMRDATHFGTDLIMKMELLIENLPYITNKYFAEMPSGSGRLDYSFDNRYGEISSPNEGQRMAALFRYWNIIQYFFPYKYLIESSWEDVLAEFIPIFRSCSDPVEYQLAVRLLTAKIEDSHAYTASLVLEEFWGLYYPPFEVRCVEGQTIVTKVYTHLPASAGGLLAGDIILAADGVPVSSLRSSKAPYVQASNEPTLQRNLNDLIFRGPEPALHLTVSRLGEEIGIDATRCFYTEFSRPEETAPAWSILEGNIGYVHMGILVQSQADEMMAQLMGTRAIIFDIRNYPNGTLYKIAQYLNPEARPFVKFTKPNTAAPGHFYWTNFQYAGPANPNPNHYRGDVVLLVDERTQSHAEFTAMCLQTAPLAVTIGSQTAGADGNVSLVHLPGEISTYFSGLGVYYPDGSETQKVGVRVDILVRPTISGIRAGRDEVLEKALEYLENRFRESSRVIDEEERP